MSEHAYEPHPPGPPEPERFGAPVGAGRGWRPWMVEDSDGRGLYELEPPRREDVDDYVSRIGTLAHDEVLDGVLRRRRVPERVAVEDIDHAAAALGAAAADQQSDGQGDEFCGGLDVVGLVRERLQAAKAAGRRALGSWSGWSGDREVDRLSAHARQILAAAVRDGSDPVAELERRDAVAKWATDDEIALADADGVLDGWQW